MACESPASAPKTLQICVPGGTFEMGGRTFDPCARLRTGFAACTAAESSEGVWHSVFQTPFGLDRTEVTNLHYRDCVEAGRCSRPQSASVGDAASGSGVYRNYTRSPLYDDYPVVYVSHAQAVDYCGFRGGRLPTEAEWEVAVSGSSEAYSWGDAPTPVTACQADAEAVAFGSCTHGLPFPVGRAKLDRRADVVDLMGNVSEWVLDAWDPLAYCDETSKALYRPPPLESPAGLPPLSDPDALDALCAGQGGCLEACDAERLRCLAACGVCQNTTDDAFESCQKRSYCQQACQVPRSCDCADQDDASGAGCASTCACASSCLEQDFPTSPDPLACDRTCFESTEARCRSSGCLLAECRTSCGDVLRESNRLCRVRSQADGAPVEVPLVLVGAAGLEENHVVKGADYLTRDDDACEVRRSRRRGVAGFASNIGFRCAFDLPPGTTSCP